MAIQYEGLNCPLLERSLKDGSRLGIFQSGNAMLSRLTNNFGLISSEFSDSLSVLLRKTERDLNPDKLVYRMPIFKDSIHQSALDQLVTTRGYYLGFNAKENDIMGYIIDPNKNILCNKKATNLSRLIQLLELEAIKYL